jgi:hypothetical protein
MFSFRNLNALTTGTSSKDTTVVQSIGHSVRSFIQGVITLPRRVFQCCCSRSRSAVYFGRCRYSYKASRYCSKQRILLYKYYSIKIDLFRAQLTKITIKITRKYIYTFVYIYIYICGSSVLFLLLGTYWGNSLPRRDRFNPGGISTPYPLNRKSRGSETRSQLGHAERSRDLVGKWISKTGRLAHSLVSKQKILSSY